jgi:hypothetical protein
MLAETRRTACENDLVLGFGFYKYVAPTALREWENVGGRSGYPPLKRVGYCRSSLRDLEPPTADPAIKGVLPKSKVNKNTAFFLADDFKKRAISGHSDIAAAHRAALRDLDNTP